jgi:hydroxymethylglutaryl-CoA synthase
LRTLPPEYASIPADDAQALLALTPAKSLTDKTLEKTFVALSKNHYKKHVEPSMQCAQRCGNMYTASLYGGLASLLSTVTPADIKGKRIAMFAFGSGCAASYWGIKVKGDTTEIRTKMDLLNRLASMKVVPCEEFVDALKVWLFRASEVPSELTPFLVLNCVTDPREEPQLCSV